MLLRERSDGRSRIDFEGRAHSNQKSSALKIWHTVEPVGREFGLAGEQNAVRAMEVEAWGSESVSVGGEEIARFEAVRIGIERLVA